MLMLLFFALAFVDVVVIAMVDLVVVLVLVLFVVVIVVGSGVYGACRFKAREHPTSYPCRTVACIVHGTLTGGRATSTLTAEIWVTPYLREHNINNNNNNNINININININNTTINSNNNNNNTSNNSSKSL